jgi:hypothetical protein
MSLSRYHKRIARMVIQLAKEDPVVVKAVIAKLRASGEIEPDDLSYLERIADRWIEIAVMNRLKEQR